MVLTHMHWDHCQNTDMFRNARILVHPTEMDYARNPNRADMAVAQYMADKVDKMKLELVSEGDRVVDGVTIVETPGHTKGHISVAVGSGSETVLIAGDALPDSGTVIRGLPTNVFWDVEDAKSSVEKMVASAKVFYPGHDRPFRLDGDKISYLEERVLGGKRSSLKLHWYSSTCPTGRIRLGRVGWLALRKVDFGAQLGSNLPHQHHAHL